MNCQPINTVNEAIAYLRSTGWNVLKWGDARAMFQASPDGQDECYWSCSSAAARA